MLELWSRWMGALFQPKQISIPRPIALDEVDAHADIDLQVFSPMVLHSSATNQQLIYPRRIPNMSGVTLSGQSSRCSPLYGQCTTTRTGRDSPGGESVEPSELGIPISF
ncbi:hypothetical protein EG68_05292 [Paragonimus skrjabini miyazakii]|uniref:Uncharacterized protein n=1 Tax=Paragonimus skrjabini miyazakii TaxID=59628 RepID=A0A8S9YRW3_9TREM|nr:hypothetical protein EG68_05292 [Paragonimus skrjabini miyazakii]